MMTLKNQLLAEAEAYCARRGISKARLATLVVNDGKFFGRVEERDGGFTVRTYEKFMTFFKDAAVVDPPAVDGSGVTNDKPPG